MQGPTPQKKPGRSPVMMMDEGQGGPPNVLDIFKQKQKPPTQAVQQQQMPDDPARNNIRDILNSMMNKPAPPPNQMEAVPRMSPHQLMQLIPPNLQPVVLNMKLTDYDCSQLVNSKN